VGLLTALFNTLIILISLFLICLILIQRGKGGGLAGAFGGVGGSSAFGTKAGDTFTRITVVTASIWILMAMLLVVLTSQRTSSGWASDTPTSLTKDLSSSKGKAKTTGDSTAPVPSAEAGPGTAKPAEAPSSGEAPALPNTATFPDAPGTGTPKK
jgi:preprotein translocase subunit SecG